MHTMKCILEPFKTHHYILVNCVEYNALVNSKIFATCKKINKNNDLQCVQFNLISILLFAKETVSVSSLTHSYLEKCDYPQRTVQLKNIFPEICTII